jgi:hypothetical protein
MRMRREDTRNLIAAAVMLASIAVFGGALGAETIVSNTATLAFEVQGGGQLVQSNAADVTIFEGYAIRGRVLDEEGAPVQGARVNATQTTRAVATATTDADGDYALTGLAAGTYDLLVTASGRATELIPGVALGSGSSVATVEARMPETKSWRGGLYLLGVPFQFQNPDPAAVFSASSFKLARWVPGSAGGGYVYYGQSSAFPGLAPGTGVWLAIGDTADLALLQPGAPASEQAPFVVPLRAGWNMVGNPFCGDIEWSAVQVRRDGQTLSLEAAAQYGWIRPYAWSYDPIAKQYVLLDAAYPGAGKVLPVWQACWVRALMPCELLIAPPGTSAPAGVIARSVTSSPQWKVQLIARTGELCDSFNYMGVDGAAGATSRANLQSPPPGSPYVDLSFSGSRGAAADLATDFKPPVAGKVTWDFVVRTDVANAQVILTWPDLSDVPDRYRLMLVDQDAQRRQYMRTTSSYVFNTGAQGGERHFQIEVDSSPWARLQVSNVQQIAARASGMTISYDLSSPAAVDVEVRTLAGQLVKTLARGASAAAGTNLISWDGTDSSGRMMANGPYLCAISAVTEEGQAVKGMRTIILTR